MHKEPPCVQKIKLVHWFCESRRNMVSTVPQFADEYNQVEIRAYATDTASK